MSKLCEILYPPAGLAAPVSPSRATSLYGEATEDGVAGLGDWELVALLVGKRRDGGRLAADLVDQHGLLGLASLLPRDLRHHGVPPKGAVVVSAALELARRLARAGRRHRPSMRTPEEVATACADLAGLDHEQLWCLPLDPKSRLIGQPRVVSVGDVDGCEAGARAVFRLALKAGATSVVVAHPHPSGDPSPSAADHMVTTRLVAAGRTVDVPLVDHVIVVPGGGFTSIRRDHPALFR